MKKLLIVVALICLATPVLGAGKERTPRPGAEEARQSDLENEVKIRKLYEDFTAAWNEHDPRAMAQFWTINGDHYEPDGRGAEGRDAVEALFAEEQKTAFRDSKLVLTVDSVWFITPSIALVNGFYEIDGVRDPSGNKLSIRKGHLTSVLLREGETWWVAASRAMLPVPLAWRPAQPEPEPEP